MMRATKETPPISFKKTTEEKFVSVTITSIYKSMEYNDIKK